jgi:hypothetical protein
MSGFPEWVEKEECVEKEEGPEVFPQESMVSWQPRK